MKETEQQEPKPQSKLYEAFCAVFCVLFVAGIVGIAALQCVTPDRKQSDSENRLLQQMPGLSLTSVTDGSFMKELESYLTDQFPQRDLLVRCKTYIDLLCGRQQINGVYIGRDDYLFEPQTVPNEQQVETITAAIHGFCLRNPDLQKAAVTVPNATCLLQDKLPDGVTQYDQCAFLAQLREKVDKGTLQNYHWIDCAAVLDGADDGQLYYRTDHHWTTRAASRVFMETARAWELDTAPVTYDFAVVSDSFQGTLASSSGICHIYDEIEICVPHDSQGQYVIEYESENVKTATFFDESKLNTKNQYEVFLGGNFAKLVIATTAQNDKTLLICKDSYANCMIPMFAPYFSQIVVIDPRYFNDSIDGCMQDYHVTHVLFLYNLNTFLEDKSLADVLED